MHFVDKAVSEVGPIKWNPIMTSTQADVSAVFNVSWELRGFTNSNQNILLLMVEIQRFCCDDLQQELAIN